MNLKCLKQPDIYLGVGLSGVYVKNDAFVWGDFLDLPAQLPRSWICHTKSFFTPGMIPHAENPACNKI